MYFLNINRGNSFNKIPKHQDDLVHVPETTSTPWFMKLLIEIHLETKFSLQLLRVMTVEALPHEHVSEVPLLQTTESQTITSTTGNDD